MIGTLPTPKDLRRSVVLVLAGVVGVLLVLAVLVLGGYGWWLKHQADKVPELQQAAAQAQGNANSANAGAANASGTRAAIDAGTVTVRLETDAAVQRIEGYANRPVPAADLDPVDADVVRELDAAEGRARTAADRLQRKGGR